LKPFEAAIAAVEPYQDETYQDVYFVTESFEDMKERVRYSIDFHFSINSIYNIIAVEATLTTMYLGI